MLRFTIHDGKKNVKLKLEHSLLSLSKWESKHKTPFLATPTKTSEEMIDYFVAMIVSPEGTPDLIYRLSPEQLDEITSYINDSRTAAIAPTSKAKRSNEVLTSDLIYSWMVALKINWEAQHWHLNRLMMLIQIINSQQEAHKPQSKAEVLRDWRKQNEDLRKKYGSSG